MKKSNEQQFVGSLEREYVFLSYFRQNGIDFCPEVYFFDTQHNFLIESFLPGKHLSQADFSAAQIDVFAKQLHQLFQLDVSQFRDYCLQNNLQEFEYVSPVQSLEMYGSNRFATVDKSVVGEELYQWIDTKLAANQKYVKGLDVNVDKLGFSWGDIEPQVIMDTEGRLCFYDFEHVSIANSVGLSYIKIHGKFDDSQFNYLIERCAYYFDVSTSSLLNEIKNEEKTIRVNDVIWAAMMWSETKDEQFKHLSCQRMQLANALY